MPIERALILAAGSGSRLSSLTQHQPKCLIEVAGKTILSRSLEALQESGIEEVWVATGHYADRIKALCGRTVFNPNFGIDNVLGTFFASGQIWESGAVCCFADILFHPEIVRTVLLSSTPIAVACDPFWRDRYQGHNEDIASAEFVCAVQSRVTRMTTGLPESDCCGEAMGIFKIEPSAGPAIREFLGNRIRADAGIRGHAMPYFFNAAIKEGFQISAVFCQTAWHEFDTPSDFARIPLEFLGTS